MPRASTTSDPFNAIAEPRRRHILEFIAAEERSVSEIADALELEQPSVSKHLQVLRDVGLVTVRRDGRRTLVSNQRRNAAHDSRLVPDVRPALARATPAHQGTRGGETMTTTAPVSETQTFTITEEISRARLARADVSSRSSRRWAGSTKRRTARRCRWSWRPHPGGRWYRDLGGDNGHLWGFVQSIKRPALLEIWGPLFMSTAATSNLLYRLSETPEGTLIKFTHTLVGPFPEDHRPRLASGWTALHARVRKAAEAAAN